MRRITAFLTAVVLLTLSLTQNASAQTTKPAPVTAAPAKPAIVTGQIDAKRALAMRLPDVKLDNARLEDAIAFLQDASGANIHVNWRALETVNVTRETPVTVKMRPMTLRKLLQYTLTEA